MSATPASRIATLDVVRGVAVCGILLMNIVNFAVPEAAYDNPRAWGGWHGADLAMWAVNFVLVDGKMRGLFSFLFGASLLLVTDRAAENGDDPAAVHFSRMGWLLVFGLAHLWLIWWGDILHHYALVGAFAFMLRKLPVRALVLSGAMLIALQTAAYADLVRQIGEAETAYAAHPGDRAIASIYADFRDSFGVPPAEQLKADIALHRSGYPAILADRWQQTATYPLRILSAVGLETLAYMLFGMAALRSGLLSGGWSARRYAIVALACFAITLPAYGALAWLDIRGDFDMGAVALGSLAASAPLRPIMITGWACLIVLLARCGGSVAQRFAAAGRMAFSNYLASSLICTTIFYGYGLGLYGALSRAELLWIVVGIWVAILAWSHPWLQRFSYGPMEWLWRSLARGRVQRFRVA